MSISNPRNSLGVAEDIGKDSFKASETMPGVNLFVGGTLGH